MASPARRRLPRGASAFSISDRTSSSLSSADDSDPEDTSRKMEKGEEDYVDEGESTGGKRRKITDTAKSTSKKGKAMTDERVQETPAKTTPAPSPTAQASAPQDQFGRDRSPTDKPTYEAYSHSPNQGSHPPYVHPTPTSPILARLVDRLPGLLNGMRVEATHCELHPPKSSYGPDLMGDDWKQLSISRSSRKRRSRNLLRSYLPT